MATTSQYTTFAFSHQALKLPNALFALNPATFEPVYKVEIGESRGVIPLTNLKDTFSIDEESDDGRLLLVVASSLRFVRQIRPGDSIPTEILDGSASWPIDDSHRERAQARVFCSAIAALTGQAPRNLDTALLTTMAAGDESKKMVRDRAHDMARLIGLPPERSHEVLDRIESLSNELAFIEALRDYFQEAFALRNKLAILARRVRDRDAIQELKRVNQLLQTPLAKLQAAFDEVDGQTGEAIPALRSVDKIVALIRFRRDELHFATLDWEDPLRMWRDIDLDHGNVMPAVKHLYRFLAQRYLTTQVWSGSY